MTVSCRYQNSANHLKLPKSEVVINNQTYGNFTIPNLKNPLEIGCRAENSMGVATSNFLISPNFPPTVNDISFNDNGKLFCNSSGFPEVGFELCAQEF